MEGRRRGQDTKLRILEEACKVFAENGFRDATHAEICSRAGANVAAINYYFGSKEALYKSVFQHLMQKAEALYPLDGDLPPTAAPEKRLYAFIHAHLSRMFDPERLGYLHLIRMAEMFDPTGLLDELLDRQLAQDRAQILTALRDFLGPTATKRDLEWCEMSIVGQCFVGGPGAAPGSKPGSKQGARPGPESEKRGPRAIFGLEAKDVDNLAEHIFEFSLAGMKSVRRRIQARN